MIDIGSVRHSKVTRLVTVLSQCPFNLYTGFAEETYDPSCQVILLSNTYRCGSSIFGQIIESVQVTLLMSEPNGLTNLALTSISFSKKLAVV